MKEAGVIVTKLDFVLATPKKWVDGKNIQAALI